MSKLNGTGPMGGGPGTGWRVGLCGAGVKWRKRCWSKEFGRFGFRRFFSKKNELTALENEEKILEEELAAIREEKKP